MTQLKINDFYHNQSDTLTPMSFSNQDKEKDEDGTTQTNISFHSFKINKKEEEDAQGNLKSQVGIEDERSGFFPEEDDTYQRNISSKSLGLFSTAFNQSNVIMETDDDSRILKKRTPENITEKKYESNQKTKKRINSDLQNRKKYKEIFERPKASLFNNQSKKSNRTKLDDYFGSVIEIQGSEKVIFFLIYI